MGYNCLMSWKDFVYLLWGPAKIRCPEAEVQKRNCEHAGAVDAIDRQEQQPKQKTKPRWDRSTPWRTLVPVLNRWFQNVSKVFFSPSYLGYRFLFDTSLFGEKLYWDQRHPSPMRHTETIPWARAQVEAGTFKSRCLICETKYGAITLGQHTSRAWSAGAICHAGTCWDMLGHAGTCWDRLTVLEIRRTGFWSTYRWCFSRKIAVFPWFSLQSAAVQASTKTRCAIWQADWCLGSWAFRRDRIIWPKMTWWYYILYKCGCILYTSPISMAI